jgi:hypothetical protein
MPPIDRTAACPVDPDWISADLAGDLLGGPGGLLGEVP